ncbi:hypothetical protein [Guyparkeria halopsychrophila]|uniref:hypothetical protein n=1 Tax=Guyparkeria halopsychrophila TaxID=3139421 RepID=UPI0037C83559
MKKGYLLALAAVSAALIAGCATSHQPPNWVYEAWSKHDVPAKQVQAEMRECGYRDVDRANDLSAREAAQAEACMRDKGFELDLSSYRPNNCYGKAPYLCKRLWGGRAPQTERVMPSTN